MYKFLFSEAVDKIDPLTKWPIFGDDADAPVALKKMSHNGIPNPILEIDLTRSDIAWEKEEEKGNANSQSTSTLTTKETSSKSSLGFLRDPKGLRGFFEFLLRYSEKNLKCESKAFVNIRDWPLAMQQCPERVELFIDILGSLDDSIRPQGLLVEEPTGLILPEEVGDWTKHNRERMLLL